MRLAGLFRFGANAVIWLLILIGIPLLLFIVPLLAVELASAYSEFSNEGLAIMALIGTPVLLGQTLLVIVLVLLRRIRADRVFAAASYKWVKLLAWNAAALAVSFGAILVWLSAKNTLPPLVLATLLIATLLSLGVALVTATLFGILRQATAVTEELEGLI